MDNFSKIYRFGVQAVPKPSLAPSESWMLAVTEEYLIDYGKKKNEEQVQKGSKTPVHPNYWINKRRRYVRYIEYKERIRRIASLNRFPYPTHGFWLKFFFPMPKSWSKAKRERMCGEGHINKPDNDNCIKGWLDGLYTKGQPRPKDEELWDYRITKTWVADEVGYIEVEIGTLPPVKITKKQNVLSSTAIKDELM